MSETYPYPSTTGEHELQRGIELRAGETVVRIDTHGAYITELSSGEHDIMMPRQETNGKSRGGCHPCLPNFGPASAESGLKQHGFGRDGDWTVVDKTDDSVTMRLEVPDEYPEWQGLGAIVTYVISDGSLTVELDVENNGDVELPMDPGFHPYYATGDLADARLDAWIIDSSGKASYLSAPRELVTDGARVSFRDDGLDQYILWTNADSEGVRYICVEPTANGASFSSDDGPNMLEPGQGKKYSFGIDWTTEEKER